MRKIKVLCLLLLTMTVVLGNAKKPRNKYGVYIAGVSASFTDSLVYITDLQYVDSASVKNSMLVDRAQYSSQFKDYLETKEGGVNRTCFVFFSTKKKSLQKQVTKLRNKYTKGNSLVIKDVNVDKFIFTKPEEY